MRKLYLIGALMLCSFTFNATFYGDNFHGNYTYSGEKFDMNKMTCASNYFPIGTKLKVTNIENKRSVIVRVNDKGAMGKYIIDLSKGAFKRISPLHKGIIEVKVKLIK